MKTKKIALWGISTLLLVASPLFPVIPATEVHAASDTFTLTKVGTSQITVTMNGTPSVQLPDGTIVTRATTFNARENKTYTFVGIDGAKKTQKSITMTTVPDSAPLLMALAGEDAFLNFESGDAHSGVKDMRYKAYRESDGENSGTYTAWEPFKTKKAWKIPTVPDNTSSTWIVKAEYRDVAGNVASNIIARFFVDNEAPVVSFASPTIYTNKRNVEAHVSITSKHKLPATGYMSYSQPGANNSPALYNLINYQNLYTGDNTGEVKRMEYKFPHTLQNIEGIHKFKFYVDKQHYVKRLNSNIATQDVVYDITPPTGTVTINDGAEVVPSNEVNLTIKTADNLSGVDKIKIVETSASGAVKEKVLENPKATENYNWNLYIGDSAKVSVVIYDKAGNSRVIESQVVTFVKLTITGFELTNNRNPAVYNNTRPFQVKRWDWRGEDEIMLAGSTIDFKIYYDLGLGQPVDYNLSGSYTLQVKSADGSYNKSKKINFTEADKIVNGFKGLNVEIPADAPKGAKVMISSDLSAARKTNTSVTTGATFLPAYIGTVGETLSETVNSLIDFNEMN